MIAGTTNIIPGVNGTEISQIAKDENYTFAGYGWRTGNNYKKETQKMKCENFLCQRNEPKNKNGCDAYRMINKCNYREGFETLRVLIKMQSIMNRKRKSIIERFGKNGTRRNS